MTLIEKCCMSRPTSKKISEDLGHRIYAPSKETTEFCLDNDPLWILISPLRGGIGAWVSSSSCEAYSRLHVDLDQLQNHLSLFLAIAHYHKRLCVS